MNEYYTPPADIIAGVRARSTKINEIIASIDAGFDGIPADLANSIDSIVAGSGVIVSTDDSSVGVLDGKLVMGDGMSRTVNDPSGSETMTLKADMVAKVAAKTATYTALTTDRGKILSCTNSFTLFLTAAATLGDGWACYVKNAGTGDITLDPDSAETIDGATTLIMYPREVRLVQCNGTLFTSTIITSFYKEFSSSGTFTKPPGYGGFGMDGWGGGGSGGGPDLTNQIGGNGGGGGSYNKYFFSASDVGTTETVTVGAGGAAKTTTSNNIGGNTTFGSLFTIYGAGDALASAGQGGGGFFSINTNGAGGDPDGGAVGANETVGSIAYWGGSGGGGVSTNDGAGGGDGGENFWSGGAAGGGGGRGNSDGGNGGDALYGGAGGGGAQGTDNIGSPGTGGTSTQCGSGGNAGSPDGTAGDTPACGGGGSEGGTSGAGGDGLLRVWGLA